MRRQYMRPTTDEPAKHSIKETDERSKRHFRRQLQYMKLNTNQCRAGYTPVVPFDHPKKIELGTNDAAGSRQMLAGPPRGRLQPLPPRFRKLHSAKVAPMPLDDGDTEPVVRSTEEWRAIIDSFCVEKHRNERQTVNQNDMEQPTCPDDDSPGGNVISAMLSGCDAIPTPTCDTQRCEKTGLHQTTPACAEREAEHKSSSKLKHIKDFAKRHLPLKKKPPKKKGKAFKPRHSDETQNLRVVECRNSHKSALKKTKIQPFSVRDGDVSQHQDILSRLF